MGTALEADCRAAISKHLDRRTEQLTAALRSIIQQGVPPGFSVLRFEYDSAHFDEEFPVHFWFLKHSGGHGTVQKLLPTAPHAIPEAVIYDPKFESAGLDTWHVASGLFIPWFAECWDRAGGSEFECAAYLAHHDSAYAFDLRRHIETKDVE